MSPAEEVQVLLIVSHLSSTRLSRHLLTSAQFLLPTHHLRADADADADASTDTQGSAQSSEERAHTRLHSRVRVDVHTIRRHGNARAIDDTGASSNSPGGLGLALADGHTRSCVRTECSGQALDDGRQLRVHNERALAECFSRALRMDVAEDLRADLRAGSRERRLDVGEDLSIDASDIGAHTESDANSCCLRGGGRGRGGEGGGEGEEGGEDGGGVHFG